MDQSDGLRAQPGATALQCAPLVFGQTAPDAGILAGLKCPRDAGLGNRTAPADRLGLLDLEQGWAGVADREEEFRVFVSARSAVAPVHAVHLLSRRAVQYGGRAVHRVLFSATGCSV